MRRGAHLHHGASDNDLLQSIDRGVWALVRILELEFATPVPATIVLTIEGVPVSTVALTGTQTVEVAVAVGDAEGNIITGDALDPGATVTVSDSAVCTAALSTDQTSILVTNLNTDGTATVTVDGTFSGAALTDFGGGLTVNSTATAPAAATIVLTPGEPQGS